MKTIGLIFFVAVTLMSLPDASAAQGWTVTCTKDSRIVYLERLPKGITKTHELEINNQNPDAFCTFVEDETGIEFAGKPDVDHLISPPSFERNQHVVGKLPTDIEQALRALRGEALQTSKPIDAPQVDPDVHQIWREDTESQETRHMTPVSADWLRLAVYRNADRNDVLADWRLIAEKMPRLQRYIPTISIVNSYAMLSIGPVADDMRDQVCVDVETIGLDCIFGETHTIETKTFSQNLSTLTYAYPEIFGVTTAETISRPMAQDTDLGLCKWSPLRNEAELDMRVANRLWAIRQTAVNR